MGHRITVHCPAKVNLGLEVLQRRGDGFHELCTVMQAIDLYDELTVEVVDGDGSEAPQIEVSGPFASEVPPEGNTLLFAWAVAGGNKLPALRVRLVKNIPSGAGLGGGSSDGAGMLVALREIRQLVGTPPAASAEGTGPAPSATTRTTDSAGAVHTADRAGPVPTREALRIGSDCPFFLDGGAQLARGRGEQLTPIEYNLDFYLVLGVPRFASSTPSAYAALRRTEHAMTPMLVPQLTRALELGNRELFAASLVNDFEPVLRQRHPEYAGWFSALQSAGALAVSLTGSGSGFYGVFADETAASSALERLDQSQLRLRGIFRAIAS